MLVFPFLFSLLPLSLFSPAFLLLCRLGGYLSRVLDEDFYKQPFSELIGYVYVAPTNILLLLFICFFPPLSTAIDITYLLEHQFTFFLLPCVTFSFSHTFEVLGFIIVTLPIQLELFPNINCIYNLNSISISSAWHLWVWCLSVYFSNACHHIHGNQMNTFTTVPMLISHSFLFDSLQQLIIQMHFINF